MSAEKKQQMIDLYVVQNLTIFEIAKQLNISHQAVYKRLKLFSLPSQRHLKIKYNNQNTFLDPVHSELLAEFFGIMFGDGHLTSSQMVITIDISDNENYLTYVSNLIHNVFNLTPSIGKQRGKVRDIIISNVRLVKFLYNFGLSSQNKTIHSPIIPNWILSNSRYRQSFIRGFFDTDGCIYKTRYGIQLSFTNRALPLLGQIRGILMAEGFYPSKISHYKVYLTRKNDVTQYFTRMKSGNIKHIYRYNAFRI